MRSCPQRRSRKSWVSNYQCKRRTQEKRWSQKRDGGEVFSLWLEEMSVSLLVCANYSRNWLGSDLLSLITFISFLSPKTHCSHLSLNTPQEQTKNISESLGHVHAPHTLASFILKTLSEYILYVNLYKIHKYWSTLRFHAHTWKSISLYSLSMLNHVFMNTGCLQSEHQLHGQ